MSILKYNGCSTDRVTAKQFVVTLTSLPAILSVRRKRRKRRDRDQGQIVLYNTTVTRLGSEVQIHAGMNQSIEDQWLKLKAADPAIACFAE